MPSATKRQNQLRAHDRSKYRAYYDDKGRLRFRHPHLRDDRIEHRDGEYHLSASIGDMLKEKL